MYQLEHFIKFEIIIMLKKIVKSKFQTITMEGLKVDALEEYHKISERLKK
jgi:hypothetical protein